MSALKRLSREAIPSALEKAERYRFLNEPTEAESICLDVLAIDATNQEALVTLLLALTDRFSDGFSVSDNDALKIVAKLTSEYERNYYTGIILERKAKAKLDQASPHAGHMAFDLLQEAMRWYEKAEPLRPTGNDDTLLRWNTCLRIIERNRLTAQPLDDEPETWLE